MGMKLDCRDLGHAPFRLAAMIMEMDKSGVTSKYVLRAELDHSS
jgi:hypothetical protein